MTLGSPLLIRLLNFSLHLATSVQSQNTRSSTYMDNNNLYQGLMQAKQIPIIRTMRSSKDHLTVIEQQLAQSPNVIKDSYILPIPGDDDMGQQIIPINKSVPQHIFALRRKEDELKYAHNKSCVIYSSQEAFYPGGKEHPSTSVVGDIDKK